MNSPADHLIWPQWNSPRSIKKLTGKNFIYLEIKKNILTWIVGKWTNHSEIRLH